MRSYSPPTLGVLAGQPVDIPFVSNGDSPTGVGLSIPISRGDLAEIANLTNAVLTVASLDLELG